MLELEARRRAFEGTDKPVFHAGEKCGTYSTILGCAYDVLVEGASTRYVSGSECLIGSWRLQLIRAARKKLSS